MSNLTTNATAANNLLLSIEDQLLIIKIKYIVCGWIILFVGIIGIILNSFTIVVLMHPKMRSFSTNAYLTALSLANIICLLSYIFLYSLRYLVSNESFKMSIYKYQTNLSYMGPYENFINYSLRFLSPLFTTFQLYAIYLTCAVTIDRWIYLTWPLKADKICTIRNTLIAIASIFVFCVLYNFPKWFEVTCIQVTNKHTNQTYYQAMSTNFAKNPSVVVINKYSYLLFVYCIPFLTLLIVNIGIIIKLIETKKRKSHLLGTKSIVNRSASAEPELNNLKDICKQVESHNQNNNNNYNEINITSASSINKNQASSKNNNNKKQKKTESAARPSSSLASSIDPKITLMIMAVVLAFFCCQFPYLIVNMYSISHSSQKWFPIAKTFCDFLASFNCCINFLIYCLFGRNFRQIAKTILTNPTLNPYNQQLLQNQNQKKNTKSFSSNPSSKTITESLALSAKNQQQSSTSNQQKKVKLENDENLEAVKNLL